MHQPKPFNPSSSRPTLKLKTAASSSSGRAVRASLPSLDTASQARGPDSPSGFSGGPPSTPLPHRVASSQRPQSKLTQKPGAAWSDEFKQRMQEDMDALLTSVRPNCQRNAAGNEEKQRARKLNPARDTDSRVFFQRKRPAI
jgi:hypothetical protein